MSKRKPRIAPTRSASPDGFSARQRKYGAKLSHWFPLEEGERIVAALPLKADALKQRDS